MAAEEQGGHYGIWVKPDGNVAETCGSGIVFVTKDRVLLAPAFSGILPSRTVQRILQVAEKVLVKEKGLLREVRQEHIPEAVAREAEEIIMCAAGTILNPVIEWDGKKVGTGLVGPIAKELVSLLVDEAKDGHGDDSIELKYPPSSEVSEVPAKAMKHSEINGSMEDHRNGAVNGAVM
eukprot:gnl/MRDRNA2_/MRDRNA2_322955_c0_seq1.p1 gnl/MRDRNA2_/MRDRNA2_322955_c0~~gnl/MRDRNA2_/MRDRNA2_322955_c0_seq1.p1  ORF type:complete len:190 (+),score=50.07 gnl/MRDRNA2_/MRDRNA2_322955_c0_seq1:38-571(+)